MKIQVTSPAEAELTALLRHYEALRPGIANSILLEARDIQSQIEQFPESYQLVSARLRRAQLATVPFQLYYTIAETAIPILGFVPASMHPARKHQLLKDRLAAWKAG